MGLSGCGAVGSARGSGLRGRRFKSDHPDHEMAMLCVVVVGTSLRGCFLWLQERQRRGNGNCTMVVAPVT